jgi:hypothetical protein
MRVNIALLLFGKQIIIVGNLFECFQMIFKALKYCRKPVGMPLLPGKG